MQLLSSVLQLIAGIGIFLIGCDKMSKNIGWIAGDKLKKFFSQNAKNRLFGVGIGTVGTAIIQSSGATTVMITGFTNAGIIALSQAVPIIFGANIGTTATAYLAAFGIAGNGMISASSVFSSLTGIGIIITLFSASKRTGSIGEALAGFGALFVGLSMMSGSMEDLAGKYTVKAFIAGIDQIFLLILIGTFMTAVSQSSSVVSSAVIAMSAAGLITTDQGIWLIIGANFGRVAVTAIAGWNGGRNARIMTITHLFFNSYGTVLFLTLSMVIMIVSKNSLSIGAVIDRIFKEARPIGLAVFHTVFNLTVSLTLLPLSDKIIKYSEQFLLKKNRKQKA